MGGKDFSAELFDLKPADLMTAPPQDGRDFSADLFGDAPAQASGTDFSAELFGDEPSAEQDGVFSAIGKGVKNIIPGWKEQAGGLVRMVGEAIQDSPAVSNAEYMQALKIAESNGITGNDRFAAAEKIISDSRASGQPILSGDYPIAKAVNEIGVDVADYGKDAAADAREQRTPINTEQGSLPYYAGAVTESVGNMVPALAAGVATRKPGVTAALIAPQVGGASYEKARNDGADSETARLYAGASAMAEAIPEKIALEAIFKPAKSIAGHLGIGAFAEWSQEILTEAINIGLDMGILDQSMTWGDAWGRIKDAGIIGAAAGTVIGGGVHAADAIAGRDKNQTKNSPQANQSAPAAQNPAAAPRSAIDIDSMPLADMSNPNKIPLSVDNMDLADMSGGASIAPIDLTQSPEQRAAINDQPPAFTPGKAVQPGSVAQLDGSMPPAFGGQGATAPIAQLGDASQPLQPTPINSATTELPPAQVSRPRDPHEIYGGSLPAPTDDDRLATKRALFKTFSESGAPDGVAARLVLGAQEKANNLGAPMNLWQSPNGATGIVPASAKSPFKNGKLITTIHPEQTTSTQTQEVTPNGSEMSLQGQEQVPELQGRIEGQQQAEGQGQQGLLNPAIGAENARNQNGKIKQAVERVRGDRDAANRGALEGAGALAPQARPKTPNMSKQSKDINPDGAADEQPALSPPDLPSADAVTAPPGTEAAPVVSTKQGNIDTNVAGVEPANMNPVVPESVDATGKRASWVIRNKESGEVVMETFDRKKVEALNTKKYEAVPVAEHLASLSRETPAADAPSPVIEGEYRHATHPGVAATVSKTDKGYSIEWSPEDVQEFRGKNAEQKVRAALEREQYAAAAEPSSEPVEQAKDAPKDIDAAAHEAATSPLNDLPEPTEAQKEAGNYKVGRIKVHGLDISIENPKGSVRRGTSPDGKAWENEIGAHYGYIRGHGEGADGDHVDVFVGESPESEKVWIIDQVNQDSGSFDEAKVMLGFPNRLKAIAAYKASYSNGWKVGPITEMSIDQFKDWLKSDTTTPVDLVVRADRALTGGRAFTPSEMKGIKVNLDVFIESENRAEKVSVSAAKALKEAKREIAAYKALLECLRA